MVHEHKAPPRGVEPLAKPSGKRPFSDGAKQNPKQLSHEDYDLDKLICAWPDLPDAVKAGIVAMVQASPGNCPR